MILPDKLKRTQFKSIGISILILTLAIGIFLLTFFYQYGKCSQVIRPIGDPNCNANNEIYRDVYINELISSQYNNDLVVLTPYVDTSMLYTEPFRGLLTFDSKDLLNYLNILPIKTSTSSISLRPLVKTLSNDEILSIITNNFNYSLTFYNQSNTDCYEINSNTMIYWPYEATTITFSTSTYNLCGRLTKIEMNANFTDNNLVLSNQGYNNSGSLTFYSYYYDYINEYLIHRVSNTTLLNDLQLKYENQTLSTIQTLLLATLQPQLSQDFGSGLCISQICSEFSVILITALLNAQASVGFIGIILTIIIFRYYKLTYNIDYEELLDEHDKITVKPYLQKEIAFKLNNI